MPLVADASFILASALDEIRSDRLRGGIRRIACEPTSAPAHWAFEIGNSVLMAVRRGRISSLVAAAAFTDIEKLGVIVDAHSVGAAWSTTYRLAREYQLTLYDAAYLELALRLRATLLTADKALAAAARREEIEIIQP